MDNIQAVNISAQENNFDLPMELDVRVWPITPKGNLLAFANIRINNSFAVNGIKVLTGEKGLYINMPSLRDAKGRYRDVCYPVSADFRVKLNQAVLDGYGKALEKMQATLEAANT